MTAEEQLRQPEQENRHLKEQLAQRDELIESLTQRIAALEEQMRKNSRTNSLPRGACAPFRPPSEAEQDPGVRRGRLCLRLPETKGDRRADELPAHEAVVYSCYPEFGEAPTLRWTYQEYRERANQVARSLMALGLHKGDHLAVWAVNLPERSPNCEDDRLFPCKQSRRSPAPCVS